MGSLNGPSDFINAALGELGRPERIGDIYEGSPTAKLALDVFSEVRDELQRLQDWDFTKRLVPLTLLKTAPALGYSPVSPWTTAYPPPPWLYEYQYPDSCIRVRSIRWSPLFTAIALPRYNNFTIQNDGSYTPARRVILANVPSALAVITARITDPMSWDPAFNQAFYKALATALAPRVGQLDQAKTSAKRSAAVDEVQADVIGHDSQG